MVQQNQLTANRYPAGLSNVFENWIVLRCFSIEFPLGAIKKQKFQPPQRNRLRTPQGRQTHTDPSSPEASGFAKAMPRQVAAAGLGQAKASNAFQA